MRLWNARWPWMIAVAVLFCAPLFVGLNRQDLDNDEAIYSFSVHTMLKDGDWVTPKSIPDGSPFLEKPPLKFWIVALPIHWGWLPDDEFGLRFWDAVMGSLAFLYVWAIGRRLAGPLCGFVAVLLLFAHDPLVFEHGLRTNNMEAALVLSYVAGIYHFLKWRAAGPDARGHVFAIALWFVLGFMTKFVAALFLPLVLAIAILLNSQDRARLRFNWVTFVLAALLAIALTSPWFVYEYFARGPRFVDIILGAHVIKRFTVFLDPAHLHPWHYYLTELWRRLQLEGVGWLAAAGAGLVAYRALRQRWAEGMLLLLWFAVPVALISVGTSKLYHYVYPFLPPVALAGAYAATVLAGLIWRWIERPINAAVEARDRFLPTIFRNGPVRIALSVMGVAALAVALITQAFDRVRLEFGGTTWFRNASVIRPLTAGAVVLAAALPALLMRALATFALVCLVLPISGYASALGRTQSTNRPLKDMRACLSSVIEGAGQKPQDGPGVWVEAGSISYVFYYYLRDVGPYQKRTDGSDATVLMNLYDPASYRPVLLSRGRYDEFRSRLANSGGEIFDLAARRAATTPERLRQEFTERDLGVLEFPTEVLLLPGPYRSCGPGSLRAFR